MKLRWTRRAEQQLAEIGRFIARDKPGAARRWVEVLRRRAAGAAERPLAGRVVSELDREDIREVIVRSYRIVLAKLAIGQEGPEGEMVNLLRRYLGEELSLSKLSHMLGVSRF